MKKSFWISLILLIAAACVHLLLADTSSGWRATYDIIMKWLNFGIFSFVLVRFGKAPVMNFLHKQKNDLAEEIGKLEKEKDQIADELRETQKQLQEGEARVKEIKERIVQLGAKEKDRIIEDARMQSQLMIEAAKKKAGSRLLQVKEQLMGELIDDAVGLALKRFPNEVNENDNRKFFDDFIAGISA